MKPAWSTEYADNLLVCRAGASESTVTAHQGGADRPEGEKSPSSSMLFREALSLTASTKLAPGLALLHTSAASFHP